jgi:PTS system nitrogen regulatory IIA component
MLIAAQLINANNISHHHEATSKKRVLEDLSQMLAVNTDATTAEKIFQALLERERLGSTGLGKGVAIPHARIPELTHNVAVMMTLANPIDFDAIDKQPIDIAFALLVPEDGGEHHLQHLARLATLFRDADACQKIRACNNADEIFELLLSIDD